MFFSYHHQSMHSSQGSDFLASSSMKRHKCSPVLSLLNSHMVMYATARFWAQVKAVGVFLVGVQQNRQLPIQPACMPRPCVSLQDPLLPLPTISPPLRDSNQPLPYMQPMESWTSPHCSEPPLRCQPPYVQRLDNTSSPV